MWKRARSKLRERHDAFYGGFRNVKKPEEECSGKKRWVISLRVRGS